MGEFTHAMRNPIRERDDRIRELESVLARAYEFINDVTAFDPPGSPSLDVALAVAKALGKHAPVEPQLDAGIPKCKTTDCWLCHGTPLDAGPR
jgi:hypothetical protein